MSSKDEYVLRFALCAADVQGVWIAAVSHSFHGATGRLPSAGSNDAFFDAAQPPDQHLGYSQRASEQRGSDSAVPVCRAKR